MPPVRSPGQIHPRYGRPQTAVRPAFPHGRDELSVHPAGPRTGGGPAGRTPLAVHRRLIAVLALAALRFYMALRFDRIFRATAALA